MFGSQKNKQNEIVAIFDIGSASVGGALVLFSPDKNPKLIYNTRKPINFEREKYFGSFTDSMVRVLNLVAGDVEKNAFRQSNLSDKKINKAFCFLSSPWNVSQTKILEIKDDKSFIVTKELLDEIVKKEERDFVNYERKNYQDILGDKEIYVMDKKIIQIKLNGYVANNPIEKETNKLEAAIFMSFINKELSEKIKKSLERILHLDYLYIGSFTLPAFSSLRDIFNFEDDFFFLDVTGEVTDVSFVKDGVLKETHSFPIGKNSFLREIIKISNVSSGIANSFLNAHINKDFDQRTSSKIEKALDLVKNDWISHLEKAMFDLSLGSLATKNLFIMADEEMAVFLKKLVRDKKFTKISFVGYEVRPSPVIVDFKKISDFCSVGEGAEKDVFLGAEAVLVKNLLKNSLK